MIFVWKVSVIWLTRDLYFVYQGDAQSLTEYSLLLTQTLTLL